MELGLHPRSGYKGCLLYPFCIEKRELHPTWPCWCWAQAKDAKVCCEGWWRPSVSHGVFWWQKLVLKDKLEKCGIEHMFTAAPDPTWLVVEDEREVMRQMIILLAKWEELEIQVLDPDLSHDKLLTYLHGRWDGCRGPNCTVSNMWSATSPSKLDISRTTSIGVVWWGNVKHKTWLFNLFARPLLKWKPVLHVSFCDQTKTVRATKGLTKCTANHVMENNNKLIFQISFVLSVLIPILLQSPIIKLDKIV